MSYNQCTYDAQGDLLGQEDFTYYDWADSQPYMEQEEPTQQPTYEYFYDPQTGETFAMQHPQMGGNVYYTEQ